MAKLKKVRIAKTDNVITPEERETLNALSLKHAEVRKLMALYDNVHGDPLESWKNMLSFVQKEINDLVKKGELDIMDDGYHKSLWEIMKSGAPVTKTLASINSKSDTENTPDEPHADSDNEEPVPIINAENASR